MRDSLEGRIRNALEAEAKLWPQVAAPHQSTRERRVFPGWAVAGATAISVLVVVAGAVWAIGFAAGGEDAAEPASLSAPAPIEVEPFVRVAGDAGEFGVSPLSEEPDAEGRIIAAAEVMAAASNRVGVVAVGNLNGTDGGIGAIWFSPDGADWERVPHDDELFGVPGLSPNTMIVDVAANDSEFLAVGVRFTEPRQRIVWRSSDGLTWSRSQGPDFDAAAVVATDRGWMVVGSGGLDARVATSQDGVTWADDRPEDMTSDTHDLAVQDVAYDGRTFAAGGYSSALEYREDRAVVWISEDGRRWERVADEAFEIPAASGITSIVAGETGFVAIGEERIAEGDDPAFAVAWHSPDGSDWEQARLGPQDSGSPLSVTANSAGYVVHGAWFDGTASHVRLWTSADGIAWETVDPVGLEPHLPRTSLLIDRRLMVFGSLPRAATDDGELLYGEGAVWVAGL